MGRPPCTWSRSSRTAARPEERPHAGEDPEPPAGPARGSLDRFRRYLHMAVAASVAHPEVLVVSDDADAGRLATQLLDAAPYARVSCTRGTDELQSRRPLDRGTLVVYLSTGDASARI